MNDGAGIESRIGVGYADRWETPGCAGDAREMGRRMQVVGDLQLQDPRSSMKAEEACCVEIT